MTPISLLFVASFGLLIGPLCSAIGARVRAVHALVDGFALAVVAGLIVVFVFPHAVAEIGFMALALAAVGAVLPLMAHRLWRDRPWTLALVALALAAHVVLDGAVLAVQGDEAPLAWAVVTHRLPVGFAIVVAAHASRKSGLVLWVLAGTMVVATVVGYLAGSSVIGRLPHGGAAALEAFVAGVLLHLMFSHHGTKTDACAAEHGGHEHGGHHHHHRDEHEHGGHHHHQGDEHEHRAGHHHHVEPAAGHGALSQRAKGWSATGALVGLLIMLVGATLGDFDAHEASVPAFVKTLGTLVLESAPALLVGYGLAGMIPFFLTPARTSSLARGSKLTQSLRGVAFGLPLPVCSCGVLPLYESLIRRGAPPVAAMAFFVATPELGVDAVLLSVPLLGSSLTLARVVSAFLVALLVALLVGSGAKPPPALRDDSARDPVEERWTARIAAGLRFGFVEVFDHTMPWIALGLIVAAMAEPMLAHGAIERVPAALQVPVAALVGVPIYVCASGATPIAAIAVHKGLSAGAAIAFLIAGPATNITTFGVLARLHGKRTAFVFGASVTVLAVLVGWTVDALGFAAAPLLEAHADVEAHASWFAWACVAGLAALTVASLYRQGPRGALRQILEPIHSH